MTTQNIILTGQLLSDVKYVGKFISNFDKEIGAVFCNYITYFFKVSLCVYHDIGDLTILKETQLKISNDFKKLCEDFSKFKRLTKIVYLPCKNKDESLTVDEIFEFSLNYDENSDFINKEDLEKYLKFYTENKTAEKLADLNIHYVYNNEFKTLRGKSTEVIENVEKSSLDVRILLSKLDEIKSSLDKLQLDENRDNLLNSNTRLVEKYKKFKKDCYYKCILKLQQTFKYNSSLNTLESCVICLEDFKNGNSVTKLKCGHSFCTECIEEWFLKSTTCPHCRKDFD